MHALHHPDRRSALRVTMLAAALAIIVTFVLVTSLTGLTSGTPSAGDRASIGLQVPASRSTRITNLFAGNSLMAPLGARIHLPWPSDPSAPTAR
jgi:hypothetical protein